MPSPHQQLVADAATDVETRVRHLWRQVVTGNLDRDEFTALATTLIAGGNARSAALADLGVAVSLEDAPVGLTAGDFSLDEDRLARALATAISDDTVDIDARLGLLARSEALRTAQDTMTGALEAHDASWIRVPDSSPCPLCTKWADGKRRSWKTRMARHTGCTCLQQAVR